MRKRSVAVWAPGKDKKKKMLRRVLKNKLPINLRGMASHTAHSTTTAPGYIPETL